MHRLIATAVIIAFALFSFSRPAFAQLVEDTNVILTQGGFTTDWTLTVDQYPAPGFDETSIFFDVDVNGAVASLTFVDMNLDEGSDWHEAEVGALFNLDGICNGEFPFWGGVVKNSGGQLQLGNVMDVIVGQAFFVGINTGDTFVGNGPARNHFGWVELEVLNNGDVVMHDNAMAYNRSQIIIGVNQIPEPGTASLLAFLCGVFAVRRRR
ncbi:MAG: PEP-CTERM sorting domain-containing protein [Planctomycetota bacterium]